MRSKTPKFLAVVAGIPPVLDKEFRGKISSLEEERRKIVWLPLNKDEGYDTNYVTQLFNNFYSEIYPLALNKSAHPNWPSKFEGVMTVYLTHQRNDDLVERAFNVETLTMSIPMPDWFRDDRYSNAQRRRAANEIASSIKRVIRRGELVLSAVSNQFVSNDNRTPLLLPERNFEPSDVRGLARSVGRIALEDSNAFAAVNRIIRAFEAQNPRVKGPNSRRSFKNNQNLLFQAPGSDRHGFAHVQSKGHQKQCLVRGRIRLGALYDPRFHYDCISLKGKLSTLWESCHGQEVSLTRDRNHVNISPNDHVR